MLRHLSAGTWGLPRVAPLGRRADDGQDGDSSASPLSTPVTGFFCPGGFVPGSGDREAVMA